ncbi:DASH family cryptochrome [Spirulina major]|uniref:DASH family cryptochrome n=1 Tax=Spirulina major TaxID=270636 RepID=UPI0009337515|nr:DASH family cryptochrome [Spirulina major]
MADRILLWYRNDLRLHDHEPLHRAVQTGGQIIPVYCIDPRQFGQTRFGFPKTGQWRRQFLAAAVADLRQSLRSHGSDLILRWGEPEVILPDLVRTLKITAVYGHAEATSEETQVEHRLSTALQSLGVPLRLVWGATLTHPEDLPFSLPDLPDLFTRFRQRVEAAGQIRPPFPPPAALPPLPAIDSGEWPQELERLEGDRTPDPRGVLAFQGGETAGFARLQAYFWQSDRLKTYKDTRNGMLGPDYSSKFSPWLALGCLSPRYIYAEVRRYETERVQNDSTYWLMFELLWRDYFRYGAVNGGDRLFHVTGLRGIKLPWTVDWPQFDQWRRGETGYPLIDANLRELAHTGFMSNRGRQNVASFLTKNLGLDWRLGAEWFESLLIDYDVCSNYGNWNYTAGVGNDARGFRYFNSLKQSKDYDPQGDYVKHWLPELAALPPHLVHEPWRLTPEEQRRYGVQLGVDYPRPMVDFFMSIRQQEQRYQEATGQAAASPRRKKSRPPRSE